MSTDAKLKINRALADKRTQTGVALGVCALAVVGIIGGASAWVMHGRAPAASETADKSKLSIQLQQPKLAPGAPVGRLAVLDPGQAQVANARPGFSAPDMQPTPAPVPLDQARMTTGPRAPDNSDRVAIASYYRTDRPAPIPAPTLQTVAQPPAPQLRPVTPPVITRAREDNGYGTPEDDSPRYFEARRRYAYEDRGPPPGYDRRDPAYERPYGRDWRDRPPPPPRRSRDDDDDSPD